MRRVLVGAALAALVLAFFLLIPPAAKPDEKSVAEAVPLADLPVVLAIKNAEIADFGSGQKVAVLSLYVRPGNGGNVTVFCSEKPLQKNMLILSHKSAPGVSEALLPEVKNELARCGFSTLEAGLNDALSIENSVIIAPTGAVPAGLLETEGELGALNARVVVLRSLAGRAITENGSLEEVSSEPKFDYVELVPGKEGEAATNAAMRAIMPDSEGTTAEVVSDGNLTLAFAIGENASEIYCRVVFLGKNSCRHSDTGLVIGPSGSLTGPKSALSGKEAIFEFELGNEMESGRSLRLSALDYYNGAIAAKKQLSDGEITPGWASRFVYALRGGGAHVLRVEDQFGRTHAAAYMDVGGLEVRRLSQEGNRLDYEILFAGKVASGTVDAWIDNGEKKQYYVSGGILTIWASPTSGKHEMHLSYSGLEWTEEFEYVGNGLLEAYARLILPALVFLAAVYFLLRGGRKVKYTITFPHFAAQPYLALKISKGEIIEGWRLSDRKLGGHGLPLTPEEICNGVLIASKKSGKLSINTHSAKEALHRLCDSGDFVECGDGLFIPSGKTGGFAPVELAMLRLLHDVMLERGLRFQRKEIVRVPNLELAIFRSKKEVLAGIGRVRRAVLFPDGFALNSFLQSLNEPDAENVRIKIARENNKVKFSVCERKELEALLP